MERLGRQLADKAEQVKQQQKQIQDLERQLQQEPVLNVDETGWQASRPNGDQRYLWRSWRK